MRSDVFSFFGKYRFKNGKQSKNRICLASMNQGLDPNELGDYGIIFTTLNHANVANAEHAISTLSQLVDQLTPFESLNILQLFQNNVNLSVNNLSQTEINKIIDDLSSATRNAFEAGFDGIEIQCIKGNLIAQFISNESNTRQDEFGGSLENRSRFVRNLMTACRRVVPKEFLLGCKIVPEDPLLGLDIDESLEITDWLSHEGADFIALSLSNVLLASKKYLHLSNKPILAYFRERLGHHYPLFAEGHIEAPLDAKKAFESGASFVALVEPL